MKKVFDITIEKRIGYKSFPFTLEKKAKQLYFIVQMDKSLALMSYLIVSDSNGIVRMQKMIANGNHIAAIHESSEFTSIGGYPGEIPCGTWEVGIYTFSEYLPGNISFQLEITEDSYDVTDNMIGSTSWVNYQQEKGLLSLESFDYQKVYQKEMKWYKGDFHTHTQLSDGKETVFGVMKKAKNMELDFYVPTEHNVIHTGWIQSPVMIIPGIEVTIKKGHFNIFGLREIPSNYLQLMKHMGIEEIKEECINNSLKESFEKGYINSMNHPFLHIWKWLIPSTPLIYFHTIEIINDPTYQYAKEANDKAICFLDHLWDNGVKLYGIGGSDSHNLIEERYEGASEPSLAGDPATYVYSEELSPASLLLHVRQGHMCITRNIELIPHITVGKNNYLPGDRIEENFDTFMINYEVELNKLTQRVRVDFIKDKKIIESHITKEGNDRISFHHLVENKEYSWYRIEVRDLEQNFLAYCNPIYVGDKSPTFQTVGEAISNM